jgi:hypothetical protein
MAEEHTEYYEQIDEPELEREGTSPSDEPSRRVWLVYKHNQTDVCFVSKSSMHFLKWGPGYWEECWAWINTYCRQSGSGQFTC